MITLQRILNLLFIFVLCFVLAAGYWYQFAMHEKPCPLCLLQRLGMIGIATALLMNLRFGIRVHHYGLAILSALLGRMVSLRQIGLHICPTFPSYGEPVFGYDLYVWAFIVFTCSIFSCAILLIIKGFSKASHYPPTWGSPEKMAYATLFFLTLANVITAFIDCGLASCV
jgi:disulfide bond formation protein DsbB